MENHNDKFIFATDLMFLRAPGRKTLPGECVDPGEIGLVRTIPPTDPRAKYTGIVRKTAKP